MNFNFKNRWYIIIIFMYMFYIGVKLSTKNNIENYFYDFNNERVKVGLKPIDYKWEKVIGNTEKDASWVNKSEKVPRYYVKYIVCDNWLHTITKEYDSYIVKIDNTNFIISILYDFKKKRFSYTLEEYDNPVKGQFGKIVKKLTQEETFSILNKNNIVYP